MFSNQGPTSTVVLWSIKYVSVVDIYPTILNETAEKL